MIIAVNCRLLLKNKLEGIGWFTYETLKRITVKHPEHRFVFIFDRPFSPEFVFADNVHPVVLKPATRHPLLWILWFELKIPRLLKKIKADLFFSPDGYLSLRSKVASISVIHDINFAHRPKDLPWWPRTYYNFFFPKFACKAFRICTVSKYSASDIAQTYDVAKAIIHVVHNGAHESYKPLANDLQDAIRAQYTGGDPYFVFVGSIHPRKNVGNLLEGYRIFRERSGLNVRMVVVGEGMWGSTRSHSTPLSPPFREGGIRGVHYTGRLEPEELRKVMGSALALTFVPWFEGFGIPVVEAMQAGVPVLTSNVTSLPEVGGKAVLYADPALPEEIAVQMERLSTDEQLRTDLIEKGFAQAKKFSWDKTAKKVWTVIETYIQSR